jgi:SAM-dependent methyltransferase
MSEIYGKNWNPADHYRDDTIARSYDRKRFSGLSGRLFNGLEKRLIRKAFSGLARNSVIGDVPCGTGRLAEVLLDSGFCVVGVDISPQMLATARERLGRFDERFRTEISDAKALASTAYRFDAALCARVLMHFPLPEQIAFLRGVAAVTDGRLVFTQGIDTAWHRIRRWLKRGLPIQRPAVFPLSASDLRLLIEQAGLREIRRYRVLPILSESLVIVTERRTGRAINEPAGAAGGD